MQNLKTGNAEIGNNLQKNGKSESVNSPRFDSKLQPLWCRNTLICMWRTKTPPFFFNGVAIYPCCAPPCPRAHPFGKTLPTNVLSLKRLLGSQFGPTFVLFIICLLCPNVHENLAHSVVQHVSLLFVYPFVFTQIFTKIIEKSWSGPFFRLANLFCGMDG